MAPAGTSAVGALVAFAIAFVVLFRPAATVVGRQLVGVKAALAEVLRLDIADVQKSVAADAKVDKRGLNTWLQIDDLPLVDISYIVVLAAALDIQLF